MKGAKTMKIGDIGWKLWASFGGSLRVIIDIVYDDDAKVYVATSKHVDGLVFEAETIDELNAEIQEFALEVLNANYPVRSVNIVPSLRLPEMALGTAQAA